VWQTSIDCNSTGEVTPMDKKLTDSEIIKALECCLPQTLVIFRKVNTCGEFNSEIESVSEITLSDIIGVINRLQAENEGLSQLGGILLRKGSELFKEIQTAKAEAYKECIEKVKEYIDTHEHLSCEECECVPISKDGLDNLLKELVGETK
jgi:hypothetical protein